jgi:hypothetical protein
MESKHYCTSKNDEVIAKYLIFPVTAMSKNNGRNNHIQQIHLKIDHKSIKMTIKE